MKKCFFFLGIVLTFWSKAQEWPEGLRGINVKPVVFGSVDTTYISDRELKKITAWGVNIVRVHFEVDKNSKFFATSRRRQYQNYVKTDDEPFEVSYFHNLEGLGYMLNYFDTTAVRVILSYSGIKHRYTDFDKFEKELMDFWTYIETNFPNKSLIGYDLINEPNSDFEKNELNRLYSILIENLDALGSNRFYLVEPYKNAKFDGLNSLDKDILIRDNVVLSVHFYEPYGYSFQRVNFFKNSGFKVYPGVYNYLGRRAYFDDQKLREFFSELNQFSEDLPNRPFIGELGVVRGSPGYERYLNDVIHLCELFNFGWAYHSYFTGWDGWNLTLNEEEPFGEKFDGGQETPRVKLLKDYWSHNR